ncbi:hypothetical protein [Demequina muriae]|uniref:SPW repeat-containing protein n=1 Tax=Demequina muriae TaxID=3051664 RepID=A0ABT8GGG9_9MICO|nr:hypothetical protein [Demequina sp. EGI L300058]MDN4480366.1 hypothetical protein [Demequina sp. EGI L300058]
MSETATRTSAARTAIDRPIARRFRIANYAALVPLIAATIWIVVYAADATDWPSGALYTVGVLMLVSITLSFADEGWAKAGAAASQFLVSVIVTLGLLVLMTAADPPVWVPLAMYSALAVICGATLVGRVENYRAARWGDDS